MSSENKSQKFCGCAITHALDVGHFLEKAAYDEKKGKLDAITEEKVPQSIISTLNVIEKCSRMDILSPVDEKEFNEFIKDTPKEKEQHHILATHITNCYICLRTILPTCPAYDIKKMHAKEALTIFYKKKRPEMISSILEWTKELQKKYPKTYNAFSQDIKTIIKQNSNS